MDPKTHPAKVKTLRRYTDLTSLVYLLTEKKLTLLDPATWDDSNDSYYLALYRDKNELKTVLALCFTQASETYHHWRVFASGPSGVCVTFKRDALLEAVTQPGIRKRRVRYYSMATLGSEDSKTRDLPFVKRLPFSHENEYRVVYESKDKHMSSLDIPIPISAIERVTLSPWVHRGLAVPIRKLLNTIKGCETLSVTRSTLIGNEQWKRFGEKAT